MIDGKKEMKTFRAYKFILKIKQYGTFTKNMVQRFITVPVLEVFVNYYCAYRKHK
jgi:hypothetical protein